MKFRFGHPGHLYHGALGLLSVVWCGRWCDGSGVHRVGNRSTPGTRPLELPHTAHLPPHPTYRDEAAPAPYPAREHFGPNKKLAKNHALFMSKSWQQIQLFSKYYLPNMPPRHQDFYVNKFVIKYNKCCTVTPWQTCPDSYGGKFYLYLQWSTKLI